MSRYLPAVFGENLMDLVDDFDHVFFHGMENPERALYGKKANRIMKTDVKETTDSYEVDVELPGFKKDDLHLDLNHGYLTISCEKSLEKNEETKEGRMIRQERYSGTMQRSYYVGDHITEEDIHASYESGVLHLVIPKKEAPQIPEKKTIMIEG